MVLIHTTRNASIGPFPIVSRSDRSPFPSIARLSQVFVYLLYFIFTQTKPSSSTDIACQGEEMTVLGNSLLNRGFRLSALVHGTTINNHPRTITTTESDGSHPHSSAAMLQVKCILERKNSISRHLQVGPGSEATAYKYRTPRISSVPVHLALFSVNGQLRLVNMISIPQLNIQEAEAISEFRDVR